MKEVDSNEASEPGLLQTSQAKIFHISPIQGDTSSGLMTGR